MEEIARFLHEYPPFSLLPFEQVHGIAEKIQIEYFAAEQDILVHGQEPATYLYIVRRGSVDLIREDEQGIHVLDTLDEGALFGYVSLLYRQSPLVTVHTREETLVYLLPARIFTQLCRDVPAFARFFAGSVVERLDHDLETHHYKTPTEFFQLHLRELNHGVLITVEPHTTVREAAQRMSEHNVSGVVVTAHPPGIITDRDLRKRVLAQGLRDSTPVSEVMSTPLLTLPDDSIVFEGLMFMTEHGIHHLPITRQGQLVGIVTDTDLLREQSNSPLLLPRQLERAQSIEQLRAYSNQVEATAGMLLNAGVRVQDIGRMVAVAHDSLIKRLLTDAEAELGSPPCAYAWLVLGSEGRYEQTLRTDQDNALVYADATSADAPSYFTVLAKRVVEQLMECGFPPCPGFIMATNPQWRRPLQDWRRYFERWINVPNEEALLNAAIFFDYRQVYGALDVEAALRPVIERGREQRIFLGRLGRAAVRQSSPLSFFRNFVVERSGASRDLLDLKIRGTALIVDLARLYALEAGCAETNTLARLRTSTGQRSLSQSNAEELSAAFELISLLRLRHQYQQVQRGEQPTNLVPVSNLSKLEQRDLKDAFRAIASIQRSVEQMFQTDLFA